MKLGTGSKPPPQPAAAAAAADNDRAPDKDVASAQIQIEWLTGSVTNIQQRMVTTTSQHTAVISGDCSTDRMTAAQLQQRPPATASSGML